MRDFAGLVAASGQTGAAPLRTAARVCGAAALAVGLIVLGGWYFDVSYLKGVAPGFPPMKPITALAFALCGILILARSTAGAGRRLFAFTCAAAVGVAALWNLLEYALSRPLGIDNLLFPGADHVPPVGRMALLTAVNFAALAAAMLFLDRPGRHRLREGIVLAVAFDSFLVVFAYVYQVSETSFPGGFGPVALNTSVAFLAVSGGVLLLRPREGFVARVFSDSFAGSVARRLLPAAVLIPLVLGWLRVVGEDRGFLEEGLGEALFAVSVVMLFGATILWSADRLSRSERDRDRAERAEAEEKAVLQSILDSMGEAVIVGDAQGRLVLFNPVAREILGLGVTDAGPQDWTARYGLYLPDGSTPFPPEQLPLARAIRGERVDGVEVLVRIPGRPPRLHVSVGRPLQDAQGKACGGVVVFHDETERKSAEAERERLITERQAALAKVKTLSGMLPICSSCKKVRDDKGYWSQIESYLQEHTEAEFSHSICPDCARQLYPEHFAALFPGSETPPGR